MLSKRIRGVLPKITSNDQTAYIKGRFIGENVRLINDIIQYSLENDSSGSVIFLDFEKAFDSLEWNYIFEALKRFNFGTVFKCILNVYTVNVQAVLLTWDGCRNTLIFREEFVKVARFQLF